jgi:hypothetical protein
LVEVAILFWEKMATEKMEEATNGTNKHERREVGRRVLSNDRSRFWIVRSSWTMTKKSKYFGLLKDGGQGPPYRREDGASRRTLQKK